MREYAKGYRLLNGAASVLEACKDWAKRHSVKLPRISVTAAVEEFKRQCVADGKSVGRRKEISTVLTHFAESFNVEIHTLEPRMIANHLTALALAERKQRNYRNVIGFFNRWLRLARLSGEADGQACTDICRAVLNVLEQPEIVVFRKMLACVHASANPCFKTSGFPPEN